MENHQVGLEVKVVLGQEEILCTETEDHCAMNRHPSGSSVHRVWGGDMQPETRAGATALRRRDMETRSWRGTGRSWDGGGDGRVGGVGVVTCGL